MEARSSCARSRVGWSDVEGTADTPEAANAVEGTELLARMKARAQQRACRLRCRLEKRLMLKAMCRYGV